MFDKYKYLKFYAERPCPLCKSWQHKVLSRKMQFALDCTTVICKECGFCFVSPAPTREAYAAFYSEAYAWFYRKIHSMPTEGEVSENVRETTRLSAIDQIKPLAGCRVLEIGPGYGRNLQLVAARGAKVSAIEPSQSFQNVLRQRGVDILGDFLENTDTCQKFDVIMLFQVLEHFHDPVAAVQRIREFLASGGVVVLDVPNIWKPFRSLDRYFLRYVHLSYFSQNTLKQLFISQGFECLSLEAGGNSILKPNEIFGIFRFSKLDSYTNKSQIYTDDWQKLLEHLSAYRWRYALFDATRFAMYQLWRWIRRSIAKSPFGNIYRKLKTVGRKAMP